MPYFIYEIQERPGRPVRDLTHIETLSDYRTAKARIRELRAERGSIESVRMIFAKSEVEAEKLLSTPRDERVIGED